MLLPKNRVPEVNAGWEGCYIVYKCASSDTQLPFNRSFVGIEQARVFGDAFLFKLKGPEYDEGGKATLQDLGSKFLQSAKEKGFAWEILSSLSKACL